MVFIFISIYTIFNTFFYVRFIQGFQNLNRAFKLEVQMEGFNKEELQRL